MSTSEIEPFLKALDTIKEDHTCGVCKDLCQDPVTLSSCFHIICAEHFESLKSCPTCHMPLPEGCKTYKDKQLPACIDSTKELLKMFEGFRDTTQVLETSKTERNKKGAKVQKQKLDNTKVDKENKNVPPRSNRRKDSRTENLDASVNSNTSLNKKLEKRNNKGETALHIACRRGKVDQVIELLNQGANTNTKDNAGWTPLHEVVQNGRLDLVKLLLQFNTLVNVPGLNNETPLHEAVRFKHKEIITELVKNGADMSARNNKGETPVELASAELKQVLEEASGNILITQGANVTLISELHSELDFDDMRVYCASKFNTVYNRLKLLSKHHKNLYIQSKFTKQVTHLIVDTDDDLVCTASLDILQGIVHGNWIISSQWAYKCSVDKLVSFQDYEVIGIGNASCNGPNKARYNRYKQFPGLFDGCHFYLHNFNTEYEISKNLVLTKATISKLISDAGGTVLRRVPNPELIPEAEKLIPYHAKKDGKLAICSHYIIFKDMYKPMYNMRHIKALPIGWLIDCIQKYELCEP